MREIKFRFWDTNENNFWDWEEVLQAVSDNFNIESFFNNDHHIAQQFTGRKDIDGKEIYEGDIIEITAIWDNHKTEKSVNVIKWSDSSEYGEYDFSGFNFHFYRTTDKEEIRVVGNIYENTDIIK